MASRANTSTVDPAAVELRAARAELSRRVLDHQLAASDFPHRYAELCDRWLTAIFDEATEGRPQGYALVAVGGYGRGELSPSSDLDLVLLHRRRRHVEDVANAIWYRVWDSGIHLDHSVRTRKEATGMARDDLKVILGLLDGRVVAGDADLAEPVFDSARDLWRREWQRYLPELEASMHVRHRTAGELAFLLEPDLKQAKGGLRDLGVLRALGDAVGDIGPLARSAPVYRAERTLLSARVAVQCRSAAAGDRLLLQDQDQVAETLGYEDADRLMAVIAEAGRAITVATEEGWRRIRLLDGLSGDRLAASLGDGIVWRSGEIVLDPDAALTGHPELVVKIALAAAERNALIEHDTLDRVERDAAAPRSPWSDELRAAFVALLQTGDALVPVVEALDQRRVFERFIPEWTTVRNRPQRNAYHRYTVDRHLLEAIARAGEHVGSVARPDLLVMAALLHDIGKGTPGDHSEVGTVLSERIARRMGFDERDVATLVKLVAYHLILPECATRRDVEDPATAALVAKLVGDHDTLELLAALTEADGQATGTSAWGPWKSDLVAQLTQRVAAAIDGVAPPRAPAFVPSPEQAALLERGELAVLAQGRRVTVVGPDRTGLFAAVTGALALNGFNVRRATAVAGVPGMALEIFDVEKTFDRPTDWDRVRDEIAEALDGTAPLADRLRQRHDDYARLRRPASAYPAQTHVKIDNGASERATVIEVRANDRLGLLHHITIALAAEHVDVMSALVDTLGHEVIDTFYVQDDQGGKLTDEARLARLSDVLNEVAEHA